MRYLYFLCFVYCSFSVSAQNVTQTFDANNFTWLENTSGLLFYDVGNGMPGMVIPAGEGNSPVFSSAFWAGGIDEDSIPRVNADYFCQSSTGENCFQIWGPLKPGSATTTLSVAADYNRFWFVTSDQINNQIAYFDCLSDPDCDIETEYPNGYTIPESILTWPGNGPDEPGYAGHLAPFVDYNGDGEYTPESGDYPNICGDFMTYLITNDVGSQFSEPFYSPLGIEIHTSVYGYYATSGPLFNTLFVRREVINRSNITYSDMYFGTFTDFDLGNPHDDYIGTDVQRSMYFAKNGDPFDDGSQSGPGYAADLPMIGVRYLAGPFADANNQDDAPLSSEYQRYGNQTTGWGDGVTDNERLGLRSTLFFSNVSGTQGQPLIPYQKYNTLRGVWRDATPVTYGGGGYNPDGGITTTYQYTGLSDPLFAGTNGIDPQDTSATGWTEQSAGHSPADRRLINGSGPFTFAPGDVQYLDYAFVFARQSMQPDTDLREILNAYADEIVGMECDITPDVVTGISEKEPDKFDFKIIPNPTSGMIHVKTGSLKNGKYTIYDLPGRMVLSGNLNISETSIDLSCLKAGIYILKIDSRDAQGTGKIIVK